MENISFITLTNKGYINFTRNCIKSLENINFPKILKVYCIDNECYDTLSQEYEHTLLVSMDDNSRIGTLESWHQNNFSNIVIEKFKIIYENLCKHEYVLFTDGDIVFENSNFMGLLY